MLELRPNCELCDKDLPPDAADARICSYECTFCSACVDDVLHDVCPNCGGGFQPRPIRPQQRLARRDGARQRSRGRQAPSELVRPRRDRRLRRADPDDSAGRALAHARFQREHARRGLPDPCAERRIGPRHCQQVVVDRLVGASAGQQQEVRPGTDRTLGDLCRATRSRGTPVLRASRSRQRRRSRARRGGCPSMIGSDCDAMR